MTLTFRPLFIALFAIAALGLRADDDETKFKAKTYTPGKSASGTAYRPATYTPSSRARPVSDAQLQPTPASRSRWSFFKRSKTADEAKPVAAEKLADASTYQQQKHISVPTVKPNPLAIQEKKPYIKSDKDTPFTPAEKSGWKNPLLKPRQGIKESAE